MSDRGMLLSQAAVLSTLDGHGRRGVSPASARWLRYGARRLGMFLGEDAPAAGVSGDDVAAWLRHEVEIGSPVTANSYLRAVRTMFSRLVKRGELAENPALGIRFAAEPPPRPKAISEEDYMAMRAAADCARDRAILDVLWSSGCRLGGLLSMRIDRVEQWDEVDGRHCFAMLVEEKGAKVRWVYVGKERLQGEGLHEYLRERPAAAARRMFLTTVQPWRPLSGPGAQHVLMRLKRWAEIPKERPCNAHAFRHAFAQRMLDGGVDLPAVSAWLGHFSPEFTGMVYVVRSERQLREKYFQR